MLLQKHVFYAIIVGKDYSYIERERRSYDDIYVSNEEYETKDN